MTSLTTMSDAFLSSSVHQESKDSTLNYHASQSLESILSFLQSIHFHKIMNVTSFTNDEKYGICDAIVKLANHKSISRLMKSNLLKVVMNLPHEYQHEILVCILSLKKRIAKGKCLTPDMAFDTLFCVLFVMFRTIQNDFGDKPFPNIPNHPLLLNGLQVLAEASEKKLYAYLVLKDVEKGDQVLLKNISGLWVWRFKYDSMIVDSDFMYATKRLSFHTKEETLPLPKSWYKFHVLKNNKVLRCDKEYQIIFSKIKIQRE